MLVTLAHLYQMPDYRAMIVGLVITGASPISFITRQILDKSRIPYMRSEKMITTDIYHTINKDVSKIIAKDREKLDLIRTLAEESFDFDAIDELFTDGINLQQAHIKAV